jgi:hypothetical protein
MEERAGERRSVFAGGQFLWTAPLPDPLPARSSRGEGKRAGESSRRDMVGIFCSAKTAKTEDTSFVFFAVLRGEFFARKTRPFGIVV